MSEPVKLPRERWEMLYAAKTATPTLGSFSAEPVPERPGFFRISNPIEIDGVVFLPADYVQADARP